MAEEEDLLDQYRRQLRLAGYRANTVKAYSHDLLLFVAWVEQRIGQPFDPGVVQPQDVLAYRDALLQRGNKPATINRRVTSLRRFFLWASKEDFSAGNPVEVVEELPARRQRSSTPRWLSPAEQAALVRAVRRAGNARDLAIIQLLLGTGLALSEVAALRLSDAQLEGHSGSVQVRQGKGMQLRSIPLSLQVREDLQAYLASRETEDGDSLFPGRRGPLSAGAIHSLIKKYAYQARLEDVSARTLRHTFARNLVVAGVQLDLVALLLGHESLERVRIYSLPGEKDLVHAIRRAAGELDL